MSDVYFTTNPAEFTQLEGLYVSERNPPGFIRGRNLSTVGLFGKTVRGPLTPKTITSAARFLEVYGGRDYADGGVLQNELWRGLINKAFGTLVVLRVAAADAVKASLNVETGIDGTGTEVATITASSVGLWGNSVEVLVEDATDADANHWNLRVRYRGVETLYENLNTSNGTSDQSAVDEIIGDDDGRLIDITVLAAGRPANFTTITEADWEAKDTADDYMALGTTLTAYTTVAGSDGTVANGDYTAAVTTMANVDGPSVVCCPDLLETVVGAGAAAAVTGQYVTEAANVHDRVFLTWSGDVGVTVATEVASVAADVTTRSDRIIWVFNPPKTLDPETGLKITTSPVEWLASVLSQNDVDIHPGSVAAAAGLAGISELDNESFTRADLISLKDAGICALEKLPGLFTFRSGVTTDLTSGKTQITRRRSADFLQLSASDRLRFYVKAKNTLEARASMVGELTAFSQGLRDRGRIVEEFEILQAEVNTAADRAQGIERLLWRVRLIGHVLFLVLETEIGTGTVIEA